MALLPQDPQKQKKLMLGLLPLLLLFGYYQFMHGGRVAEVEALETRLDELTAKNNAARTIAAGGGAEMQQRLAIYEQHMVRLEELIPSREEVPELLHAVSLRAQEAGVDLGGMAPDADEPGPFYTRKTFEMSVVGSYHDVGVFLSSVGQLPRIITPIELKLAPRQNERTRAGDQVIVAGFRVETYILPVPPPAPAITAEANAAT